MMSILYAAVGLLVLSVAIFWYQNHRMSKRFCFLVNYFSHEIRNPLYGNRVGSEVLAKLMAQQSGLERERILAKNIMLGTDTAFEVVAALKNFAPHYGRSGREVVVETVDLSAACSHVISSFTELFHESGIMVEEKIESFGTRVISEIDFKLVVRHLARNALQAVIVGQNDGEPRKISVKLCPDPENNHGVFEISDNGVGMDAATRRKSTRPGFSIYDQAHGMGLAIVSHTLKKYGLNMAVNSRKGRGTTVSIVFPVIMSD